MLAVEDVLRELQRATASEPMNQGLPPGFRFHPTDEELVTFYLAAKVFNCNILGVEIAEIDHNRCEPWELPEVARMGEKEWYFFSLRDRKYPTGLRTNRATCAGYWKATGKDRQVHSASMGILLGMKKTLVFYHGRAPHGEKTKWVMHEYRLDGRFSCRHSCKDEWVVCRITHKTTEKKAIFLDQGQQSRQRGTSFSIDIDTHVLRNTHLQVQETNPLMNFECQPGPSLHPATATLFKAGVAYREHEAVANAAMLRQCKTEPILLPHLQDSIVTDDAKNLYQYNLCGEAIPLALEGSFPVDA